MSSCLKENNNFTNYIIQKFVTLTLTLKQCERETNMKFNIKLLTHCILKRSIHYRRLFWHTECIFCIYNVQFYYGFLVMDHPAYHTFLQDILRQDFKQC